MNATTNVLAVLVATENSLQSVGGGVQVCTADYVWLLRQAGFDLHTVSFAPDHRVSARVLRRLEGRPYLRMIPPSLADEIAAATEKTGARFVFFNLIDFPGVVSSLRRQWNDGIKLVHLSHGLDSTDICIDEQVRRHAAGRHGYDGQAARKLGGKLHCEADYRRYLDAALCLSPLDAELERWLGVRQTAWFSRPIREARLAPQPVEHRVGCVSTLDHPPNYHGLVELFNELHRLQPSKLAFRLVGGPEHVGRKLAERFSFVEYQGRLSDADLRREAESWACFVHPIFHYARGCSTKVAVALGWGLPIATTIAGARGYVWDEAILPIAPTPGRLAASLLAEITTADFGRRRERALRIAALQPSAAQLAAQMRDFLLSVGR
ncbi:MAG: glycosyltransferase [Verrucomicrobiae bacterium]|nr:glycosyltransferase [Verrucomicrobiae bacterium]